MELRWNFSPSPIWTDPRYHERANVLRTRELLADAYGTDVAIDPDLIAARP